MLIIRPMFELSDLSIRSMNFGFEFLFLDLGFHDLDLRFVKINVGYCH